MRTTKMLIVFLFVLGFSTSTIASEWTELAKNERNTQYVDETSITTGQNGLVQFVTATVYNKPQTDVLNEDIAYTSTTGAWAVNCLNGTVAYLGSTEFLEEKVVSVYNVEQTRISFDVPDGGTMSYFKYVCNKAGYGPDAFEKARSANVQAANEAKQGGVYKKNGFQGNALTFLLKNPSAILHLFVYSLASALVAYGCVWILMRPKGHKQLDKMGLRHFYGVLVTDAGGVLFRIIAMVTFPRGSAFDMSAAGGVAGFYMLIVPAFFAAGYIMWLKKKIIYEGGDANFSMINRSESVPSRSLDQIQKTVSTSEGDAAVKTLPVHIDEQDASVDLARYKRAADEVETGKRDDALWYKAFAEADGNENATKAAYIRMRVDQLRREASVVASKGSITALSTESGFDGNPQKQASSRSLYDVLGVSPDSSFITIDNGYHKQKELLDSLSQQDAEVQRKQKLIEHAKEILSDHQKRDIYDKRIARTTPKEEVSEAGLADKKKKITEKSDAEKEQQLREKFSLGHPLSSLEIEFLKERGAAWLS